VREGHALEEELNRLVRSIGERQAKQKDSLSAEGEPAPEKTETIHVYIVLEGEEPLDEQVVDSTLTEDVPLPSSDGGDPCSLFTAEYRRPGLPGLLAVGMGVLLPLASIVFQVLLALLTPTPTIVLVPLARHLSTTATITVDSEPPIGAQIPGRLLPSLTLTQTKTAPATGKGHQDAQYAWGAITFYNGLFTAQTVAAGTRLVGSDGVQVVTDQVAVIPAAYATTPPTYGRVTVSAQATQTGPQGNISVRDINEACCLPSVLAQNTVAFQGGHNERDYTVVTRADRDNVVSSLTATLGQSEQAALSAQLAPGEALATPACKPEVTPDHQPGAEAASVTVTVSVHCTAVAYESVVLQERATSILTTKAQQQLGTHYSLIGAVQVSALQAMITDQKRGRASIAVTVDGTWTYQFSQQELWRIKQLVVGKTQQQAIRILLGLPGIQRATIEGIGENQRLPKERSHIQIRMLYGAASSAMSNRHWFLEL